jgi:hypothetical protein
MIARLIQVATWAHKKLKIGIAWGEQRRWVKISANLSILLALAIVILRYLASDWSMLTKVHLEFNGWGLVIIFGIYGVNFMLFAQIWHYLVGMLGGDLKWAQNAENYAYSNLSRFLPTPIWFLTSRALLYEKHGLGKKKIIFLTFYETLLHFITGIALVCVLMVDLSWPFSYLYLVGLIPVAALIAAPGAIIRRIQGTTDSLDRVKPTHSQTTLILILYLTTWILAGYFLRAIIQVVSPTQSNLAILWKDWVISSLISYLSAYTLGGVGLFREISLTFLLSQVFGPAVALIVTILSRVFITLAGVVWSGLLIGVLKVIAANQQKGTVT